MAESAELALEPIIDEEPEETKGYVPPAQKSLEEIQNMDADDESLQRYKHALLAGCAQPGCCHGPNVVVQKIAICPTDREDIEIDLTGDINNLKKKPVVIKEGCEYRVKIYFLVKREIVAGLKFHQVITRNSISVDKESLMVGSYGPRAEPHCYQAPLQEAPKGMISRGHYVAKSKFVDDDKVCHLAWEWSFDIKKDWCGGD